MRMRVDTLGRVAAATESPSPVIAANNFARTSSAGRRCATNACTRFKLTRNPGVSVTSSRKIGITCLELSIANDSSRSQWSDAIDARETAPAAATRDLFLRPDGTPMAFRDAVVGGRAVGVRRGNARAVLEPCVAEADADAIRGRAEVEARVTLPTDPPTAGRYVREWRNISSDLTRALGRPIRDQVTSVRATQPTTPQALELVKLGGYGSRRVEPARHRGEEPCDGIDPVRLGPVELRGREVEPLAVAIEQRPSAVEPDRPAD